LKEPIAQIGIDLQLVHQSEMCCHGASLVLKRFHQKLVSKFLRWLCIPTTFF
jgi:hypothetical protein